MLPKEFAKVLRLEVDSPKCVETKVVGACLQSHDGSWHSIDNFNMTPLSKTQPFNASLVEPGAAYVAYTAHYSRTAGFSDEGELKLVDFLDSWRDLSRLCAGESARFGKTPAPVIVFATTIVIGGDEWKKGCIVIKVQTDKSRSMCFIDEDMKSWSWSKIKATKRSNSTTLVLGHDINGRIRCSPQLTASDILAEVKNLRGSLMETLQGATLKFQKYYTNPAIFIDAIEQVFASSNE